MTNSLSTMLRSRLRGEKDTDDTSSGAYTGPRSTEAISAKDGEELDALTVYLGEKGEVAAIMYGSRLLPFYQPVKAAKTQLPLWKSRYNKGLAGNILKIVLSVPKGL